MRKRNKIRFEVVSLICALIITAMSAAPLFHKHSDAHMLALIFGSMGAGVMLSNLIHDLKRKKDEK